MIKKVTFYFLKYFFSKLSPSNSKISDGFVAGSFSFEGEGWDELISFISHLSK